MLSNIANFTCCYISYMFHIYIESDYSSLIRYGVSALAKITQCDGCIWAAETTAAQRQDCAQSIAHHVCISLTINISMLIGYVMLCSRVYIHRNGIWHWGSHIDRQITLLDEVGAEVHLCIGCIVYVSVHFARTTRNITSIIW